MIPYLKQWLLVIAMSHTSLGSEVWVQGAHLLHRFKGQVALSELGKPDFNLEAADLPLALGGLFTCELESGAAIHLSTSNRGFVEFRGPGKFGIERFEQTQTDKDGGQAAGREYGQSRMLLSLRAGHIFIDTRGLGELSRLAVETPLGRITTRQALWQMNIRFDQRSGIFDFEVVCSDGRVYFTDRRGTAYELRAGQRLAGAGGSMNPGVEVVESTEAGAAAMQEFLTVREELASEANRTEHYLPAMKALPTAIADLPGGGRAPLEERSARPVTIEYAPRAEPLIPFRGEIPPPSALKADIF